MKTFTLSLAIAALFSGSVTFADSWNITQVTTTNSSLFTTINQKNATSNSLQGMNVIKAAGQVTAEQMTATSGGHLLLQQTDSVSASTQAANYAKPHDLNSSATYYTHQNIEVGDLILAQTTSGSNVIQAGNLVDASTANGNVATHQEIPMNSNLTLHQQGTDLAVQAANGVITNNDLSGVNSNWVMQGVSLNSLASNQGNASNSTQAVNYVGAAR